MRSFEPSSCVLLPLEVLIDKRVQPLAVAHRNLERPFVGHDHQHLPRAVVYRGAAMAAAKMLLNLLAHLGRDLTVKVVREICDYRFAADHGFVPFKRSQNEAFGLPNTGVNDSRIISLAR